MKMRRTASFVLAAMLSIGIAGAVQAQPKKAAKRRARRPNRAFAPVKDDPSLPRVLLIGDSISIGYTADVRADLAGKANVHRAPTNCGPTIRGLEQIDKWLGDGHWDVIHFNWGLHDLKQINGKRQVPLDQYEKNLKTLVARMKKTGARLIWCSTTPVPAKCSPPRTNADVIAYNAVAKKIMEENGIPIDDLYALTLPQEQKIQIPSNVHFTAAGYKVLARQVAASILKALKTPAPK